APGGEPRLVAYIVPGPQPGPPEDELRLFLRKRLPEPMIPSLFVPLAVIPLTPNGKLDRGALPKLEQAPPAGAEYVAPGNAVEEAVAGVFAQTLGVGRVGVHDSFFKLGGHSLLATQLVSRLRNALHVEIPLRDVFESPTVAGIAHRVESLDQGPGT